MSNLTVSLSPHVRAQSSTRRIMLDVLIALIPAVVFAVYWFGFSVLVTILLSMAAAIGSEALMQKALRRPITVDDGSAAVTGLLLALTLPAGVPWYVPVLGAAFAIVIAKQVFGGLGDNFVNPALAGRAFLLASFPVAMTTFPAVADAVSSATPLSSEFAGTVDYAQAFLGRIGGSIGEVSKLALLAGAAYLLVRRVIDWRVPGELPGDPGRAEPGLWRARARQRAAGRHGPWRLLHGHGLRHLSRARLGPRCSTASASAAINFAIRQWGAYPEGVTYAILLMNIASPLLERATRPRKYGEVKRRA